MGKSKDKRAEIAANLKAALDDYDTHADVVKMGEASKAGDEEEVARIAAKYRGSDGLYNI